jgi:hypothetical protein
MRRMHARLAAVCCAALAAPIAHPTETLAAGDGLISYDNKVGIHALEPNGTGRRTLVSRWGARRARWSPDGRRFAYHQLSRRSEVTRSARVVVAWADGSHRRVLARGHSPEWLPGGREVAYMAGPASEHYQRGKMMAVDIFTRRKRVLAERGFTEFSANGRRMWFNGPDGPALAGTDGTGVTPLGDLRFGPFWHGPTRWLGNARLAYNCWNARHPTDGPRSELCVLDLATGRLRMLHAVKRYFETSAAQSPSGRRLAVSAANGVYLTSRTGHGFKLLVDNRRLIPSNNPTNVDWQPRR